MATITFSAAFSGGLGTLSILIDGLEPPLQFKADGSLDIILTAGAHNYIASGAAADDSSGSIQLIITGDVLAESPKTYGPGTFPEDANDINVNS
jgi:hypothetical protein